MVNIILKINCYCLTRSNTWSEYPIDFELKYPAHCYMQDIDKILKDLLNSDMVNEFYRIKLEVLNEDGSYFTDHDFMIYLEPNDCIVLYNNEVAAYRNIRVGDIVCHYKHNKLTTEERKINTYKYRISDIGFYTETGEPVVIYQALYEPFNTFVRPYDMFMGVLDYDETQQVFRFYKVDRITNQ